MFHLICFVTAGVAVRGGLGAVKTDQVVLKQDCVTSYNVATTPWGGWPAIDHGSVLVLRGEGGMVVMGGMEEEEAGGAVEERM